MFLLLHYYEKNIYKYNFNEKWVVNGGKHVDRRKFHLLPKLTYITVISIGSSTILCGWHGGQTWAKKVLLLNKRASFLKEREVKKRGK